MSFHGHRHNVLPFVFNGKVTYLKSSSKAYHHEPNLQIQTNDFNNLKPKLMAIP